VAVDGVNESVYTVLREALLYRRTDMIYEDPEKAKLVIIHDYQAVPGACMPGEEVVAIILIYRGRRYRIPLSPTHLILLDYLARCRYPEDAWRISSQMQLDPFTTDHGSNAPGHQVRSARTSRVAVRLQVSRIRRAIAVLIAEEGLDLIAEDILRSEETSTRAVRYKIDADVTWEHWAMSDCNETNIRHTNLTPIEAYEEQCR
jgi:hypothetical protein